MKRRSFGLLAGGSLAALKAGSAKAAPVGIVLPVVTPQTPLPLDASLLKTTLTPFGAERAGNADGSIPAWTGGLTTIPDGWQSGQFMPDPYASDAMLFKIDASNMAQHADKLSYGVMMMMQRYPEFYVRVFPTHRPAAGPQDVYDNAALNVTRGKLSPAGPQEGFSGAVGGTPFPILDVANPLNAGAQCYWNSYVPWKGRAVRSRNAEWAVSNGRPYCSDISISDGNYPYYLKGVTPENFNGLGSEQFAPAIAPANSVGQEFLTHDYTDPVAHPNEAWELLNGQGRVRKTPNLGYDNPSGLVDGLANYDEYYGFANQPDRYDWKYLGKKEIYTPYVNNTLFGMHALDVIKAHCFDPEAIKWELHRTHAVLLTVRPGQRNVLKTRLIYFDEDTWEVTCEDAYDANDTLLHVNIQYFLTRPDVPMTTMFQNSVNNLQTDEWTPMLGLFDEKAHPSLVFADAFPESEYNPANMAASAQY